MIRLFFRMLRVILGPFMLLWEALSRPQGIVRSPENQQAIDRDCQSLALYQFKTCPFCIKVRQEMRRLSLNIQCPDAQREGGYREELLRGGGQVKVPCLRVREHTGTERWLYESESIVKYLRHQFDKGAM